MPDAHLLLAASSPMPDHLLVAFCYAAGGVAAGLLGRIVLGRLRRHAQRTSSAWDDIAIQLLRNVSLPIAMWAGHSLAVQQLQLPDHARHIVDDVLLAAVVLAVSLALAGLASSVVRSLALARSGVAESVSIFVNIARRRRISGSRYGRIGSGGRR